MEGHELKYDPTFDGLYKMNFWLVFTSVYKCKSHEGRRLFVNIDFNARKIMCLCTVIGWAGVRCRYSWFRGGYR